MYIIISSSMPNAMRIYFDCGINWHGKFIGNQALNEDDTRLN